MKKLVSSLLCASALWSPLALAADATAQLQQRLQALPQFSANFSQQAFDFDNQLVAQSSGTMALKAPLRFRWHQTADDELLLTSNGEAVWYYDPYVEQVTINAISDVLEQTPLPLLSSQDPQLWAKWQVAQQDDCFALSQADGVQMQVCFAGEQIASMQMIDAQGNRTLMTLSEFTNEAPQDTAFEFVAPEGTFVDDRRQQ
ncbi:outer membrane lipoprotein chaperone LolA [Ferrimonas senticii]|uniref:outer membrane lipoprotein chaperone LolA n=1 Tax=Ferrimonas senticii TaxID=394566 RepID=UPI0004193B3F|nr:outer membrane lipoprotein chaperone LolA [Ferrimonas senticii]